MQSWLQGKISGKNSMSTPTEQHRTRTLILAGILAAAPYIAAVALYRISLDSDLPFFQPESLTLHASLSALILLGLAGFGASALMLRRCLACESLQETLAKQSMNEQFIEAGKMASIGELAAGIAHEINNPVAIMVEEAGWMDDLLQEDADLADSPNYEELLRALAQIRTQGARCKEITHKMLSFARKSDMRMHDVHLNALIQEVAALSEKRARYANCRIDLRLDQDLPPVSASASEMQQIFLNLVNNALDAMEHKGGTLTITSRKTRNMAEIQITDTGEGIPKANLTRIFDPFYTTKPVGKGTGLGLSICYTIITNMGGDISVSSQINAGTTFSIRLPLTPLRDTEDQVSTTH
jgi:signal transduction histidine kinase